MRQAVAGWALLGIALALSSQLAAEYLWILSIVPVLAWGAAGLVLGFMVVMRLGGQGQRASAIKQGVTMLATAILFFPLSGAGGWLTNRLRFMHERAEYDRVVAMVAGSQPTLSREASAVHYVVDGGPPVRVAFRWPGGVIDNWCGVVHDPTAEVMKVNALEVGTDAWRAAAITRLFGGDMTACDALDGAYYLCCFT